MARVSLDTLLRRSERNMGNGMNPIVKQSALEVIRRAYKEGIHVQISQGMRTYAEQNRLYAQGRTAPGSIVTNARGGQSNHNFGLAVDFFLTTWDGTKATWTVNDNWRRAAAIAKSLGFEWGGDWRSFKDYPHLEMTGGLSTAQLRAGSRPSLTDRTGTATPSPSSNGGNGSSPAPGGTELVKTAQRWANQYKEEASFRELDVDGLNGPLTMDALLRICQLFGKTAIDGIWGPRTKASVPEQSITDHQPGWTRLIQATLVCLGYNLNIDGIYGTNTRGAISAYQRSQGIGVDGIAGPETFEEFFKTA
ncbi:peptidoglycan L-alanyl-D-glutamate endopeptidase CwlK [Terribacillus aidingensis]|uniref:Peptidoglycan L-alanyl-D-glutamate endopeptidase CwlK n=1 Tax=Terribacillus aidingensis TaxID=586416 RepID=A0A285NKL5_9BACI|nr:peptidoglycan-binding protein [Terribacillus aidingensis]SNZ10042.1 peptidoglycan L-alanyl-D-glutamate endopeptidase CwlK [Terribacillus aidingensis]